MSWLRQKIWVLMVFLVMGSILFGSPFKLSAQLKEGDIISKDNWEQVKGQTFDGGFGGGKIEEMLTPKLIEQIVNWNLKIRLKNYQRYEFPIECQELTKKYGGTYKLEGKRLPGYIAGIPFPWETIDPKDPKAGWKAIWNVLYGRQIGDQMVTPKFGYVFIDGKRGVERMQHGEWANYYYKNRSKVPPVPVHETPDNLYSKNLLFFVYPYDIRGLGMMAIKYDDDRNQQSYAYLRSVRRIRRLSSAAWMDPIGGTDQLYDDQEIYDARPEWYDDFKYLGRKKMLITRNLPYVLWKEDEKGIYEQFPWMDLRTPPFWQPLSVWEPAWVHVIECIPPSYHPYSKKIIYVDEEECKPLLSEMYDRKGEFWKFFHVGGSPKPDEQWGRKFVLSANGHICDYQKMHATAWNNPASFVINPKGISEDYFTVERLRAAGK